MSAPAEPRALSVFNGQTAPPVKPVEWLVEKVLARGAGTLLFGQPGVSKSVHAAHLVACLIVGRPFAHLKTVTRGLRVLYLDFDGSWEWNRELFEAAFRGVGVEGIPAEFIYFSPNTEECQRAGEEAQLTTLETLGADLAYTVKELRVDLVVCDSLGQMMVGDTNSGQDVALALRLGLNPSRKAGAAVLVIDHATKGAAGGVGIPTPMGSQQKRAWARVSVALEAEEDHGAGVTRWTVDKSNTAKFEPFLTHIHFVGDGERLERVDLDFLGEAGPRPVDRERIDRNHEVKQDILELLQDGPLPRGKLGRASGTLDRALKALETSGQVVKVGRGVYGLPGQETELPPHQPLENGVVVSRGTAAPKTAAAVQAEPEEVLTW